MAAAGHGVLGPGARGERCVHVVAIEGRNKGMQGRETAHDALSMTLLD